MKLIGILFGPKCAECGQRIKGEKFPTPSSGWVCQPCHSKSEEMSKHKEAVSKQEAEKLAAYQHFVDGKELVDFGEFMIAVAKDSPICTLCSLPTYSDEKDSKIVFYEEEKDNSSLLTKAAKALVMAKATKCHNCNYVFCWKCVITVGSGSCPNCGNQMEKDRWHGRHSLGLLDSRQKDDALRAVMNVRNDGETGQGVGEIVRQKLVATGWDDVDSYFGHLLAEALNARLNEGKLTEDDLRSKLGLGKSLDIKFSPEIARWAAPLLFLGSPALPVRFNAKFDREAVINHLRTVVSPLDVKDILIDGRSWDD